MVDGSADVRTDCGVGMSDCILKMIYPPIKIKETQIEYPENNFKHDIYLACFTTRDWYREARWGMLIGFDMGTYLCNVFLIPDKYKEDILGRLTVQDWVDAAIVTEKLSVTMKIAAQRLRKGEL